MPPRLMCETLANRILVARTVGGLKTTVGRREVGKGCPLGIFFLFLWLAICDSAVVITLPNAARAEPADESDEVSGEAVLTPLVIETATGAHQFEVEVAATDEARTRGLMYRQSLAPDRGMLFDYGRPTNISMWMKNTFMPLDMLFVDKRGVILKISTDTVPGSLKSIRAKQLACAVLEVPGGTAARIGAVVGNRVRHQNFGDALEMP